MSDGTPLEAIESGDVANTADESRMQAILRDMNATNQDSRAQMPPQPHMQDRMPLPSQQPMPPMLHMNEPMYRSPPPPVQVQVPYTQDEEEKPKKNMWAYLLDQIRDPLFVIALFFVLSLPAFHTLVGKYATWAFATGGELSWLGLGSLSLLAGILFSLFRVVCTLAGF